MGQYLKKPASNRVKGPFLVFRIDYKGHWHVTFDVINFEKKEVEKQDDNPIPSIQNRLGRYLFTRVELRSRNRHQGDYMINHFLSKEWGSSAQKTTRTMWNPVP